jgi:lysophospholipase L1-like esterase
MRATSVAVLTCVALLVAMTPAAAEPSAARRTVRVMPLGDSITYGVGSSTAVGYRRDLWLRLRNVGVPVDFVGSLRNGYMTDNNHEGHIGWRIDQIDARVSSWMATYQPDVVLLHIGTNDVGQNYDLANAPRRLSVLIDRILARRPGVRIFVAQLARQRDNNPRWTAYVNAIPGVVASKGRNVHLVPQHLVGGAAGDLVDHTHPSNCGYAKMSYVWYHVMGRSPLNTTGRPWPTGYYPFNARTGVCAR